MKANGMMATHIQVQQLRKGDTSGLRSPGMFAKWPMIGLIMFLVGGLAFGALTYNLLAQGPLLQWDRTLASILPVIGLQNPATLKPIMNAGYYIGDWGIIGLAILFSISSLSNVPGRSWPWWCSARWEQPYSSSRSRT